MSLSPPSSDTSPILAYVGLGANLGDAADTVHRAAAELAAIPGITGLRLSPLYGSAPVNASGPDYVNAVASLRTMLPPLELLAALQAIEQRHGRERPYRNAPRTLDLDLLLYADQRIDLPGLTVPHPRMHERAFVLRPLRDLASDLALTQGNLSTLLARCTSQAIHPLETPAMPTPPPIRLVVAYTDNRVIGRDGTMPWHLPADLAHFKRSTLGHPIIMGRKTWLSLGRPLPGRRNLVLSRDPDFAPSGAERYPTLEAALTSCTHADLACVIGGEQIFRLALPLADELIATEIHTELDGDTWFPPLPAGQWRETERLSQPPANGLAYDFVSYRRIPGTKITV